MSAQASWLALCLGLVTASAAATAQAVTLDDLSVPSQSGTRAGTLPGVADVSAGKATYHVDVPVPPGVNGLVPAVSLSYGGGTDIGLLGIGWSMHASSSIQRCPPTIAQDGVMDTVRLTNADRLCLDGQRLVPATALPANCDKAHPGTGATQWPACFNTVYWGAATEYRTEVESGTRVLRITGGFQVYTRDGRIHWYGNAETTADKFVRNGGSGIVHTWVPSGRRRTAGATRSTTRTSRTRPPASNTSPASATAAMTRRARPPSPAWTSRSRRVRTPTPTTSRRGARTAPSA